MVDCENETCDDCLRDDSYYAVSAEGRIYVETLTRAANGRPLMKRFIFRAEDGTTKMVLTSKSFNMTPVGKTSVELTSKLHSMGPVGNYAISMMSIKIKHFLFKILIQFEDVDTGQFFYDFVVTKHDLNRDIRLSVPNVWRNLFWFPGGN